MQQSFQSLLITAFVVSAALVGTATADDSKDKELGAMDVDSMSYVEARMSEDCHLEADQEGSQSVVDRNQCKETLESLEEELSGVHGSEHELQEIEEFRETFSI